MLKIENLTKYYGNIRGVEDLSLELRDGEIFGFIGPNGAGNCGSAISAGHRCRRSGRPAQR